MEGGGGEEGEKGKNEDGNGADKIEKRCKV
jgi:hypothetical protein